MGVKKGEIIEATIDSTAFKGKGVARYEGIALFVGATAPGDRIRARIVKKKKSLLEGKLIEILEPSPLRIEPLCSHADACGGCTWQHLDYKTQIIHKEQHVRDHLLRIAGLKDDITLPIIGCDMPFYYRNKMEYSFSSRRWLSQQEIESDSFVDDSGFAAGLHAPGRFDKILNLTECHLQHPVSFRILDHVRSYCVRNNIAPFDSVQKTGFMRHLVIRNAHHTDDLMINLVTFSENREYIEGLRDSLLAHFPEITTIVQNINDLPNPTATGRYERILHGPGIITDKIGNHSFRIDANAFFQTNTLQAEKLYDVARDFANLKPDDHLFDLYCGVGTLTLFMADRVRKVTGIELVDVAVKNALQNAHDNNVSNSEFVLGDMKDTFNDEFISRYGRPDCIVTDPPRSGMHPDVIENLIRLRVPRLVYVSCNPSTMARDLKELNGAYSVDKVQPVDMFPQTYHIEAVAQLTAREGSV
ncbi:MAG: 23S rRNA (uracil(1939)-C(5))-methyltransferase RlmD [Balneolaceae bacterium]|nr:MAG: 23S rRNA (uracil(1939)-C(5))-methyltransferase RlmD [Balneolaceae bacterium]